MPGSLGTIERLIIEFAKILQPLKDEFRSGKAHQFFQEIGLPVSPAQEASLSSAINAAVTPTFQLVQQLNELLEISEEGDQIAIAAKNAELFATIKLVIDSFSQVKNAINALSLPGVTADEINQIPGRLFNQLIVIYFEKIPGVVPALSFTGVLDQLEQNVGSTDPNNPPFTLSVFNWGNLTKWLKPSAELDRLYKWGSPAFDGTLLLSKLGDILSRQGIPVLYDTTGSTPVLDLLILKLLPKISDPKGLIIQINGDMQPITGDTNFGFTTLNYTFDLPLSEQTECILFPDGRVLLTPPTSSTSEINGKINLEASLKKPDSSEPYVIIGQATGSRLQFKEAAMKAGVDVSWNASEQSAHGIFIIEGSIKEGKLVIDPSSGDGFLNQILPKSKFEADFDLTVGVNKNGFFFRGSSGLEIFLPLHIEIGPIAIQGVTISPKLKDEKLVTEIGVDIKTELGPLVIIVQNIGVKATFSFESENTGNLGPLQLDIGFKPPNGAGLTVDAGGLKGGGFLRLDPDKGEYFGSLELEFKGMFSLKAVGIINTKLPDGSEGFSLLIIITAEFVPIQLSFGFTLNGVGGILGYNRTTKIDVLREGIRTNAIKSILFPENVVANINRIISDIKQVFPPQEGHFIVGPMGKIGWGTPAIITLELGLIIEIPVPRVVILGVLKSVLPDENAPILSLQINFLGIIDFENQYISFDASLYDSRLLFYTLTGDMAFRLSWGDKPFFLLTVGGFHPAFKEAPGDLQNIRRITLSLLSGGIARITAQTYFAVTSNTVQFGAKAELLAGDEGGFNIYGFIGYDVLFQFKPFKFIADFAAGIALRRRSSVYMSIRVTGQLSGPSPWDARGEASVDFFFFSISVSFHETWGDRPGEIEPEKADLIELLSIEINDNRNWVAAIPQSNSLHVSIKQFTPPADKLVVHPFGMLTFSERLVPLRIDIQKFGTRLPKDVKNFDIRATDAILKTEITKEQFAPANFFDLKDADKLSRQSFELMESGFKISGSSAVQMAQDTVNKDVIYEFSYLRKKKFSLILAGVYRMAKSVFVAGTKAGSVGKSTLSHINNRISVNAPDKVALVTEKFVVAGKSDMKLYQEDLVADSYTEAVQLYNNLVKKQPGLKDQVQIISNFELNPN